MSELTIGQKAVYVKASDMAHDRRFRSLPFEDREHLRTLVYDAIMEERERCAQVVEGIAHEGNHASMWESKFKRAAALIRKGW